MDELQLEQVYSRGLGAHFLSGVNHRTVVRGRGPRVRIKELIPLVNTRVALTTLIAIRVRLQENGHDPVAELHELFERKPDDAQVRLRLEAPRDFSAILDLAQKVRPDREFRKMVERIRLTGDAPPPRSSLCPMQSGELTCSETIP